MCYPLISSKRCLSDCTGRIKIAEKKALKKGLATAAAAALLPVGTAKGTAYKYERAIRETDDTAKLI